MQETAFPLRSLRLERGIKRAALRAIPAARQVVTETSCRAVSFDGVCEMEVTICILATLAMAVVLCAVVKMSRRQEDGEEKFVRDSLRQILDDVDPCGPGVIDGERSPRQCRLRGPRLSNTVPTLPVDKETSPRPVAEAPFFTLSLLFVLLCSGCGDLTKQIDALKAKTVPPKLVVNGPTTGVPGEPLHFNFSQTTGTMPVVVASVTPKLEGRPQFEVNPLTRTVTVFGYPGRYQVTLDAWNLAGHDQWSQIIEIPGTPPCPQPPKPVPIPDPLPPPIPTPEPSPGPSPTPPPEPTPAPSPEPPPGRFNVAPEVYRLAKQINDPAGAKSLSAQCRTIADGQYGSLNAMATDVVKTLGTLSPAWQPLTSRVKAVIAALYTEGKLQNRDDAAELLREVAGALEAAGK